MANEEAVIEIVRTIPTPNRKSFGRTRDAAGVAGGTETVTGTPLFIVTTASIVVRRSATDVSEWCDALIGTTASEEHDS